MRIPALVGAAALCVSFIGQTATADAGRPNVLLIVADDMGFSDIAPFGGEIDVPTLEALAAEGLKFTNFHVLPSCSPTRSVLLTGTDNHVAGLGAMAEFKPPEADGNPGFAGYLNFQVAALPEVLSAAGYRTYMAGKWHLGHEPETSPHARGFDETFVLLNGWGSHWADQKGVSPPETMTYRRNGEVFETLPDDFYSTRYYTTKIVEWTGRDKDDERPFFAYLAFTAPHDPLHAPREYIEKHKGAYDKGWDSLREERLERLKRLGILNADARAFPRLPHVSAWEDLPEGERAAAARDMEVYAAMIDYMDVQIGRLFEHLKEIDEYANTLILFLSDNGAHGQSKTGYPDQTDAYLNAFDNSMDNRGLPNSFVEPGPGWAQVSMTPSRLFKAFPSEGGIRSPMLVKLPGKMELAGKTNKSFLHVRDLMPTIPDAVGVEQPGDVFDGRNVLPIQGRSFLPVLEGTTDALPPEARKVGYELFGMQAFISDTWKILKVPEPNGTGEWQLYDLERDPAELDDLSGQHPDKRTELVRLWEDYKQANGVLDIEPLHPGGGRD